MRVVPVHRPLPWRGWIRALSVVLAVAGTIWAATDPAHAQPTSEPTTSPAPTATAAPYPTTGGEAAGWECRDAVADGVVVGQACTVTTWGVDPEPLPYPTFPAYPATTAVEGTVALTEPQWAGVVAGFGLLILCGFVGVVRGFR